MPARLTKRQADTTRSAIQATQLVNRLHACAMGEIELTAAQLRAIEILLRKSLPDLSSIELTGDDENPVAAQILVKYGLDSLPTP